MCIDDVGQLDAGVCGLLEVWQDSGRASTCVSAIISTVAYIL